MFNNEARKQRLINAYAIALAKGDEDACEGYAMELYEVFGWCGTPHFIDVREDEEQWNN